MSRLDELPNGAEPFGKLTSEMIKAPIMVANEPTKEADFDVCEVLSAQSNRSLLRKVSGIQNEPDTVRQIS
ncbi:hypothetical protein ACLMAL_37815 [Nocardia sp. CWNU-33]|uniref:hypothetical protein n=1 Tax=Nocardia sp. CWNU-33 TaxID=3392117 RepID=UPI00398EB051